MNTYIAQTPTTQANSSLEPKTSIFLSDGTLVFGSVLFSAVSSAVVISFFLSGLKNAINEVRLVFDSKLKELALEQKNTVEKILLTLEYRDTEIEQLKKQQDKLSEIANYINNCLQAECKISQRKNNKED